MSKLFSTAFLTFSLSLLTFNFPMISWLEHHTLPCMWKKFLGVPCPGCGAQSSILELMQGHVMQSIKIFPALLPLVFLMLYFPLHLVFGFRSGHKVILITALLTAALMAGNYLIHIIHL
jgi:hypothetical protein